MNGFVVGGLLILGAVACLALGAFIGRGDMLKDFGMTWTDYFRFMREKKRRPA